MVPGTTIQGNLAAGAELRTAVQAQNSINMLPEFQSVATALGRMSNSDPDKIAGALGRTLSLRGSFNNPLTGEMDPERARGELAAAGRMLFAYRNQGVSDRELEMFQRRARVMGERMAPETYFGGWTAGGIQSMSGNVFGTALNAFGRQMTNGIMGKDQAAFLQQYGFIAKNARGARVPEREIRDLLARGEIDEDLAGRLRTGAAARFNKRDIVNSDLAGLRPDLYFDWAVGSLRRQGVVTPDERDAFANRAGSTNTGRQLWSYGLFPEGQRADRAAVGGVNMNAIGDYLREGFNAGRGNMEAGVTNATASLGMSSTDDVTKLMNSVARGLNDLGDWARANPDTSRILLDVGAGLTAVAAAGLLFTVGSAALSGLGALAGAIGTGIGLAGIAGTAAFAFMVSPLGLLALGAGITAVALSLDRKDWETLFAGFTTGIKGLYDTLKAGVGLGPGGAGATGPTILPGVGVAPNLVRPPDAAPGGLPSSPGLMPGLPSFRPLPGQRSDAGGDSFNLASAGGGDVVINLTTTLDGRVIAQNTSRHLAREFSRPARSGAGLDSRMALPDTETA
ncbi:phage tail tape measure protein [Muricoccus nepalensis]|uniref:hypothetical protein n=1 Tax=Muricoccus nepalensis TaxID=1854500 RepID=UPI001386AAEC|nr:hypothetical protein [Roseomonas nepalensis]